MKTFNKLMGDIRTINDLVNKYKPVVQDKIKEYEPIIKNDAENIKNKFEKEVLPSMKKFGNSFKDSFKNSGVNSNSFNKK